MFASYDPKGKRIAVSLRESEDLSNILLLNKKGKTDRILVQNGWRNFYPKWSNDGREILYFSRKDTKNEDDEIYRINLNSGKEYRLTNWPKHNFCPSWSNDNAKIVYVTSMEDRRPEIYIINKDGSNPERITFNEDGDTLPNWHPSEDRILITGYRNGSFQICELSLASP